MTFETPRSVRAVRSSTRAHEGSWPAHVVSSSDGPQFGPGISVVRDWPRRHAVVVGNDIDPLTSQVLTQLGFVPVLTGPERADEALTRAGPFTFLVLGPDVFGDDSAVGLVRDWHTCSPSARLKLVHSGPISDPRVLVRAIRAGVTDVVDLTEDGALHMALRGGLTRAGQVRERVLAIGAHPDDVELGCGGTLLDHRRRGDRLTVLTLSRGAVGGDRAARQDEAAAAADALGAQLLLADLPDTEIDDGIETIRLIERVVRAVDPTVVYVHSGHDNHQDHRAVSTATRSATRGVRRVFAYQSPSATNDFLPTCFVNVEQVVRDKVKVLAMFGSQADRSYLEPEMVWASARYWARHLATNARYAEPFEVIRSVGELRHSVTTPTGGADASPVPLGASVGTTASATPAVTT